MNFRILTDEPESFNWKLSTPWGKIEIYSGCLVKDPFKESGVAEYMLESHIESYAKYIYVMENNET